MNVKNLCVFDKKNGVKNMLGVETRNFSEGVKIN